MLDLEKQLELRQQIKTITMSQDSNLTTDSGLHFMIVLRALASDEKAPQQIKNDWKIMEDWLGCSSRDLTSYDEVIGRAWRAYVARGVAASFALQPIFESCAVDYKATGRNYSYETPPDAVMAVFDRILATDTEIKHKWLADYGEDVASISNAFKETPSKLSTQSVGGWWERTTKSLFGLHEGWRRVCIVVSGIWITFWLAKAVMLQSELWEMTCSYTAWACKAEIRSIWWAVTCAIAGPVLVAGAIRLLRWIKSGFGPE